MAERSKSASARNGVARVVQTVVRVIALILVARIVLQVLDANPDNDIVAVVNDVADFLVGPFEQLFTLDDRDLEVAVNYGIAALAYLIVGGIVVRLIAR